MENKIKEEELKNIQEQQNRVNKILLEVGYHDATKHALLHDLGDLNKDIEKTKQELEKSYGKVNINLEDGTYKEIEEEVEELETSDV